MPSRGNLGVLFWTIGLLMGLFARDLIGETAWRSPSTTNSPGAVPASSSGAASIPDPITVNAVLTLPTATATPPPKPTTKPPATARPNYWTGQTEPGVYQVPPPTSVPPTPLPVCREGLDPKAWCVVPEPPQVAGVTIP